MRFLILGQSVGKKKAQIRAPTRRSLELGGPSPQHNYHAAWKEQDAGYKINVVAMELKGDKINKIGT